MKIGVNTYGFTKELTDDFDGTLERLRAAGADFLEVCLACPPFWKWEAKGGMLPLDRAPALIERIRQHGLPVPGAHILGMEFTESSAEYTARKLLDLAGECRLQYYVLSLAESKIENVERFVGPLRTVAGRLRDAGIGFLYHNHEHELCGDNGDTVLDFLMRSVPEMDLQLDVGWVAFAGVDPLEVMKRYAERIRIVHFKDMTADACEKYRGSCYPATGEGVLPLEKIMERSETLPLYEHGFVLDQDASGTSLLADTAASIMNIRAGSRVSLPGRYGNSPFDLSVWSMSCATGERPGTFWNLMQACSRSGVRYVDLMAPEVELYGLDTVRHILTATNMRAGCYITVTELSVCRPEPLTKALDEALETAQALGADQLMIVPWGVHCSEDPEERRKAADELVKCFQIAVERGKDFDIQVCVEDTPSCFVPLSTSDECKYVLDRVPGLGLVFDTANMLPGGETPEHFYDALRDRICHVHLKDVVYVERGKGEPCADGRDILCVPSGQGIIPLRRLIRRLEADGYKGRAMLEYARLEPQSFEAHRDNVQSYLTALFG